MTNSIVQIPFHNTTITATNSEGRPMASVRHMCEAIGLDYSGQLQRIKRSSWGTVVIMPTVAEDGKIREVAMIDRRVITIWLATVDISRIKDEDTHAYLALFQNEAADALDSYFHEGGAINPNATEDQLDRIARQSKAQMEVLAMAQGLVDGKWLETRTKIIIAKAMGEKPEIAPADMPLYAEDYLNSRPELTAVEAKNMRSTFGKRLAKKYKELTGKEPQKAPGEVGFRVRAINSYTEADRWIFDKVWEQYYAEKYISNMSFMDELESA